MDMYEVSTNLIDQVQILLKKEAGLETFNSNDHSLDCLSSSFLNDAILGSNASVDVIRCNDCKGKLLRRSESIICVYCGMFQHRDFATNPMSFKSTIAFQWLLQSLGLDGFESVEKPIGGDVNQSGGRVRSSLKEDEISLSDFLDLQLKWPDNLRGSGVGNKQILHGKRNLNLIGVDIEQLLSQENKDDDFNVRNEHSIASNKFENEESRISGERSLNLFENRRSSMAASRSGEGENDESLSEWGAEFQSSFPVAGPEKSGDSSFSDAPSGSTVITSSNDNDWSNLESGGHIKSKVSDGNVLVEGGTRPMGSVDSSFDLFPQDQQDNSKEESLNSENIDNDDSFDEWGDFRMSVSDKTTQCEPSSTAVLATDSGASLAISDSFDGFVGSTSSEGIPFQNNNFTVPNDAWSDFMIPSTGGNIQSLTNSNKLEDVPALGSKDDPALLDVTLLEHQGIHGESLQKEISYQDDSIGLWGNDAHLGIKGNQLESEESKQPASGTTNDLDNSFDLWDVKSSANLQQATNMQVNIEGGSKFEAWDDFVGMGTVKKQEQACVEVDGGKGNTNQIDLLRMSNDSSFDVWSDFTGTNSASASKPMDNDISSGAWNDFSSLMVANANSAKSNNTRTSEDQAVLDDDNMFSSWNVFQSSGIQTENSSFAPNDIKISSDQISFHKTPDSVNMAEENSTFSSWGQVQASEEGAFENKLNIEGELFSGLNNGGQQYISQPDNQLQFDGITLLDGKSLCETDDSFDAWSDFTGSSNTQVNFSSSINAHVDEEAIKHGDLLDAWNVTASSPDVQAGNNTSAAMEKTPDTSYPDLYGGIFSTQYASASQAFATREGSDLVRTEHADKAGGYMDTRIPSDNTSEEGLNIKSPAAETLISEMHDLSFMLESSLSSPNHHT
ncbi:uncharacterized protein LOC130808995 [Amaranthus tricolor]|uniref:uncharacterized protein LOC130808995 n=1 Tax=Amaranthus tricolor TaxID=29722 RepID=UPI0025860D06|nr:uncharacterized protein LOC130808995 [Amaranthus tricolor]